MQAVSEPIRNVATRRVRALGEVRGISSRTAAQKAERAVSHGHNGRVPDAQIQKVTSKKSNVPLESTNPN